MKTKGQSTLEYAVIIAVVVAGLLVMQIYMKRGVQGKLRESTDRIGEQYSAGHMTSTYTTEQIGTMKTKETFGLDKDSAPKKGVSEYTVETPAERRRSATGTEAEKVTQTLSEEKLIE